MPEVICIVGPTGVGKSDLAQELAVRRRGIVLSADSMQIYRGMDIGTAKVTAAEQRVPHYGIDLVDPAQPFSAAQYQTYARGVIDGTFARGEVPVVCGGTGLYIRAALDVMEFPGDEQPDAAVRAQYEAYAEEHGAEAIYALLQERDPAAAELLHPHNSRRVIRALEMLDEGVSYAEQARQFKQRESYYPTTYIGLDRDRAHLYARIDARVDAMIAAGLLQEVERLLAHGFRAAVTSAQAIGYKELVPVIEEGAPLAEAIEAIKQASRRYAKRQLSWFRADPRIKWLNVDDLSTTEILTSALAILKEQ